MRIETESGFTADIDEAFRDDWEFVEALDAFFDNRAGSTVRIAKIMLGEDVYKALKEHCRSETTGRISTKEMNHEIFEILHLAGKNS